MTDDTITALENGKKADDVIQKHLAADVDVIMPTDMERLDFLETLYARSLGRDIVFQGQGESMREMIDAAMATPNGYRSTCGKHA